ncbi:alpha/beta fold hydrolase [Nocardia cerradoensis]|uniref:2-hydroxy-6-oxononadienedioate/2-hydroxy-6-oxononatrienedioate hydrolase n=1 Tax=Nocardia cerradoensis TaxID=85688 RepID=A0A231HGJ5_9NOCA|nr:alpha/beta fold hydrolase [Nocardia cerradoensis]NKY43820.1 alpha/beta fold hydrolase [Nocardia cerradoensis]OXR47846.1 2-hydroxy-6-oxononadienedioate/2-hydroxy-6-oxononatrienedioate hydrolase [Nocardia cerradoensis]
MTIWNELTGLDFSLTTVDANGVPTRALRSGAGEEAVVFLHGTSGHLEAFARNIPAHAPHYECHAIDMLGHGYTGKPDYPYEIPRYVAHLVDYLDAVGIQRAHLVGESLGGWVAAHLASELPERVLSLQLLAAGGTVANPVVMERIKTSTLDAVRSDDIELTRARLRLLMHDPVNATEELVEVRHRIYHQPDFVANIHNLLSLQEMEIRQRNLLRPERLARIQAPTLVVWGHENPFGDVPEAKKLAEDIPGARLQLYPECGHWPQHEQAARYNPLSLEFLAEASAKVKAEASA